MICHVCSKRFAPRAIDSWTVEVLKDGLGIKIVPITPMAQDEWQKLFDSDFKCPCQGCSLQ